ncbi:DUF4870 domain-containing protein [Flavobacterium sp.]|uniref:DUF4870 domain-containing protein n=1 Tax=Flavobacterium sp. TaxID=239 RepID=UPI00263211F4|nr:DUF4870 domain-containing protein [Flavobacterium sp.]
MEYTEGNITTQDEAIVYPHEHEQAGNAYLMAIVGLIAGLPLPIVNFIASLIYYFSNLKSSYYVRWHCIQAMLAQLIIMPFNSVAIGWTLRLIFTDDEPGWYYGFYIFGVILLNICEFVAVMITASKVKKGENVRWAVIAVITDALCSKRKTNNNYLT